MFLKLKKVKLKKILMKLRKKLKKLRYIIRNNNLFNIYLICDNNISKISQVFAMSLFD